MTDPQSDLDRLLELERIGEWGLSKKDTEEYNALKSKIEGKIVKWDNLMSVDNGGSRLVGGLSNQKIALESQVAKLKERLETVNDKLGNELQVKYLEIEQLRCTLDYIKTFVNGSYDYACITDDNVLEAQKILKEILAKHEDNI